MKDMDYHVKKPILTDENLEMKAYNYWGIFNMESARQKEKSHEVSQDKLNDILSSLPPFKLHGPCFAGHSKQKNK